MIDQLSGFEKVDIDSIEKDHIFSNRKDFKYLFAIDNLPGILQKMEKDYLLMTVGEKLQQKYATHYFDTTDFKFYLDHHNGILNRMKVRSRFYADGKAFIEVKKKSNKGITFKNRLPVIPTEEDIRIDSTIKKGLDLPVDLELALQLKVAYKRLTFYSRAFNEKVTIDTSLSYNRDTLEDSKFSLVIAESKGIGHDHSYFNQLMKENKFKRSSFSKYCYGLSLLEPAVKKNNFKSLHHKANKIIHAYELSSTDPEL